MKNYFYSRFSSIIRAKLIVNQQTGRSKGYAFFEFSNYKEFCEALNTKEPLIFGKQKLVLNSAKNRFEYDDEDKLNELKSSNNQLTEDRKSLDSINQPLSSTDTGVSSIRNSKESINTFGDNHSFLCDKIKPEINDDVNMFKLTIKNSLKKLTEEYIKNPNENKSTLFNYFCTPFLNDSYNKKNYTFHKNEENYDNNNNLETKVPFEPCKDK